MWRLGLDAISAFLLVIAILTLAVAVLVWQRHRTQKTIVVWLFSGVLGILLGSVASYALVRFGGYMVVKAPTENEDVAGGAQEGENDAGEGMGGAMPGMGGGGMGRGGGMGGGGMGGGGRTFGQPSPKRDLTTLVRKLDLLTGDVAINLSDEQAASLAAALADVEKGEAMSDEDAQAKHDEILALFDEDQTSRLNAIALPRAPRGGRGGPGGGPGGGGPGGPGGGAPGGPGGAQPDPDANPFQQDANLKALDSLRNRLAPGAPADQAASTKE